MASPERQLPHESNEQFRARMRASGMKLVRIWVPDPASPDFIREAQGQTLVIADSPEDEDDLAFVDSIAGDACLGLTRQP